MILAKVLSRVVSNARLESIPDGQLLAIEPLEGFGDRAPLVAIAGAQAGPGDLVLVLQEGSGARQAVLDDPTVPLPAQVAIVGIVDAIETR